MFWAELISSNVIGEKLKLLFSGIIASLPHSHATFQLK